MCSLFFFFFFLFYAAGFGAGVCEAICAVTPMELIKTQLIHDLNSPPSQRKYKGVLHGTTTIIREQGLTGLYKGLTPTMLKQGTNQATRFLVFTELKKYFQGGDPTKTISTPVSLFCGAVAGFVSVMANNPVDVVKTKMQGLDAHKFKNSFHCFRYILVHQGPLFFYKGVTPRLLRVMGDAAIVFTAFGYFQSFIEKHFFK
jgi:solute carrier family 25 citrate transporter 1